MMLACAFQPGDVNSPGFCCFVANFCKFTKKCHKIKLLLNILFSPNIFMRHKNIFAIVFEIAFNHSYSDPSERLLRLHFFFSRVMFPFLCFHADIFTLKLDFHLLPWHLVFKPNKHESICFENMWVDDKVVRISDKCQRQCWESQWVCVSYMKTEFGALWTDSLHTAHCLCFCGHRLPLSL